MRQANSPSSLKTALQPSTQQTQATPSFTADKQANPHLSTDMAIDDQEQLSATKEVSPTAPPSPTKPLPRVTQSTTRDSTTSRKGMRCPAQTSILAYMPPFLTNLGPPSTGVEKKNE